MNDKLYESLHANLKEESSEKLFKRFKSNGNYNFERKLIAGEILKKRSFSQTTLKEEKTKILKSIQESIIYYKDNSNVERQCRRGLNKKILLNLASITFFILLELRVLVWDVRELDYLLLTALCLAFMAGLIYHLVRYDKNLNTRILSELKMNDLYEYRLELISKYWNF